jgi:hypothetical protein
MLDGYGFLVVRDDARPHVAMYTSYTYALDHRRHALDNPDVVAVADSTEIRRLADAADTQADERDNTRTHLVVHDCSGVEVRRVDITGKPWDVVALVHDGLTSAYGAGAKISQVTNVYGRDLPCEPEGALPGFRA